MEHLGDFCRFWVCQMWGLFFFAPAFRNLSFFKTNFVIFLPGFYFSDCCVLMKCRSFLLMFICRKPCSEPWSRVLVQSLKVLNMAELVLFNEVTFCLLYNDLYWSLISSILTGVNTIAVHYIFKRVFFFSFFFLPIFGVKLLTWCW